MTDFDPNDMYRKRYFELEAVLDKALGAELEDGAGEGVVQEVRLLVEQRDEARAEAERLRAAYNSIRGGRAEK